jgi:hypothetical protein
MGNAGLAVFVMFFGISLLDALTGGHWLRALFWIAMGAAFWALQAAEQRRATGAGVPGRPPK